MSSGKLVLGLAGMPGSGKSLVVEAGRRSGYGIVAMGDVIREETEKRGLTPDSENIGEVMLDLRKQEGSGAIAKRCVPRIMTVQCPRVMVDGIRSLDEVEEFKKHLPKFALIAVHASPEARFSRLYSRRRSDDSVAWGVFHERDVRELGVGVGGAIAMAEYVIVNDDSIEVGKRRAMEVLEKVEKRWIK